MRISSLLRQLNCGLVFILSFLCIHCAIANPVIAIPSQPQPPTFLPTAPNLSASSYILLDANTGKVLAEKNANTRLPPASLTKLMTLYIVSAAIKSGQLHWDDKIRISTKAWKTEGSRMFAKVGEEVPVKELLRGIIIASGNDAAVALAEHLAGTEEAFTALMNQQAKQLGMNDSHFTDSTGLPHPQHYSTAHDLAVLTMAYIRNFPEDYSFYSEKWFSHNGIKQPNRNRLLWRYQSADGLKTGHTNEAGYCLVASAKKNNMRLISVVMGEPSDLGRTEDSIRLMTYGFRFFETKKLVSADKPIALAHVWAGQKAEVPLGLTQDLYATIPAGQEKKLKTSINVPTLNAPVIKGQSYGQIEIKLNNEIIVSEPLIALANSPKGGLWRRSIDAVKSRFQHIFSRPDEQLNTG